MIQKKEGFSLVEVLMVMFIASVVFVTFYKVSTVGARYIIESKNKLGAVAIANEKMEIIRNLKYDDVGIQGGIPSGNLLEDEDVTENAHAYHVHTYVQYQDDPFDGVAPADLIPNDYKSVKVVVSLLDSAAQSQQVSSLSRFVPPGLEANAGGAPLAINVKGSDGVPVKQANVHITNSSVSPAINFSVQTDDDGHLMIPSAPESLGGYHIDISKSGYEAVSTVDPSSVAYTPTYRNPDVLLGALNMYDYIEDKLSDLTIRSLDYQNNPVADIGFSIKGGRVIGRDALGADKVETDAIGTTDINGEKKYSPISPGIYNIIMDDNAKYEFIDFEPSISPEVLAPGTQVDYIFRLVDKSKDSLVLKVTDAVTHTPIMDAKVTLTDSGGNDIFSNKSPDSSGILVYPDSADPLTGGAYTLKIEASNYAIYTDSISINKLTKKDVELTVE